MAFDSLTEKLQNVFKNLRSKGRLTEDDVKAALKEVKMALLEDRGCLDVRRRKRGKSSSLGMPKVPQVNIQGDSSV